MSGVLNGGVPLLTGDGGQGQSTFTLYPVFASPEEEYKYITWRMAELERHLGMPEPPSTGEKTSTKRLQKREKKKLRKEKDSFRKKNVDDETSLDGAKGKPKKEKKEKKKRRSIRRSNSSKEKEVAASDIDLSQENEATSMTSFKGKEAEKDGDVPEELSSINHDLQQGSASSSDVEDQRASRPPRLRKAASFLFNKTSEMRSYFRKMSADIRDLAHHSSTPTTTSSSASSSSTETEAIKATKSKEQKRRSKHEPKKKQKKRRSAQNGRGSVSDGEDLNNLALDDTDDGAQGDEEGQLTYDERYTDAVIVFHHSSSSSAHHRSGGGLHYGHFTLSDQEAFTIMIEEDSATYDSPTLLPVALPEVEVEMDLDDHDHDDDDDININNDRVQHTRKSSASSARSDSRPFTYLPAAPSPSSPSASSPRANQQQQQQQRTGSSTSLASKASYRMTMPPVPPSAAQPPHPASRRAAPAAPPEVDYLPYRSGWGAQLRPLPPRPVSSYAHSSGAVPTSARLRTGTAIY